jgi:MoxR-like ATPase
MTTTNNADFEKDIAAISRLFQTMGTRISEFVVGHQPLIDLISIAMLAEGHILIEGAPGTAKTIIAKGMAQLSGCTFRRIQSAVDIQPADILGIRIFDPQKKDFILKEGPIFSHFLLVDEINRLSPKTQGAFIEAMSEEQVTIDGITTPLSRPFFVMATQNPYEYEGTFPLIEAQKDRFMFSTRITHLSREEEMKIIERADSGILDWAIFSKKLAPLAGPEIISRCSEIVQNVHMEPPIREYITDLVMATRAHSDVRLGASARASITLVRAAKSAAALENRSFVLPDDIKKLLPSVLQHRLILKREAEIRGITSGTVLQEIIDRVEVP